MNARLNKRTTSSIPSRETQRPPRHSKYSKDNIDNMLILGEMKRTLEKYDRQRNT